MIIKNFYFNIIIRILLVLIISAAFGFLIAGEQSQALPALCLIADIILAVDLFRYFNQTNKKIAFFFDAVRNEDSNLTFPSNKRNRSMSELYKSMKKVNDQIQQLRIENIQQEQYFQTLIEHIATGIITYNKKGFVLHANTAAKALLSTDVLTHIQQIERINHRLFQAVSDIQPYEKRLVAFPSPKGEVQLSLKATYLKTGDDELTILSVQDIKYELDEKEIDSWLKLIRVLMHEIMNSITPITSLSETISGIFSADGKPVQPEELSEDKVTMALQGLDIIKERGKGLMSFVESYRKLTKIPDPVKKTFRVSDLITRIKVIYNSLKNNENIELSVSLKNPDHEIFADENLISQVLINLLKNAIEANADNPSGKIMITAGLNPENQTEISVIDNGPGIPEENLDKIFVPFFTTKEDGSGIGLSLSKQIMRAHRGNLKVRSIPGKETIFSVIF